MGQFVKLHEQFAGPREPAVDRDIVAAHHAIVKAARPQRHLYHIYFQAFTGSMKIAFGELALIPADLE